MPIRRLQYQIDYIHILTFREEYKLAVAPYFGFDNLEYGIENENTIMESIKLIFKNEQMAIFLRKEGMVLIYEGDVADIKNQNGSIKIFWELFEKVKTFKGFRKCSRQILITHQVDIKPKEEISKLLEKNPYLLLNPIGKLNEFACIYEFEKDDVKYKFEFGNFSQRDIKTHELMPFQTKFNDDLIDNTGMIGRLEATEIESAPSFSKYKSLLTRSENIFQEFKFSVNEKK